MHQLIKKMFLATDFKLIDQILRSLDELISDFISEWHTFVCYFSHFIENKQRLV